MLTLKLNKALTHNVGYFYNSFVSTNSCASVLTDGRSIETTKTANRLTRYSQRSGQVYLLPLLWPPFLTQLFSPKHTWRDLGPAFVNCVLNDLLFSSFQMPLPSIKTGAQLLVETNEFSLSVNMTLIINQYGEQRSCYW